MGGRAFAHIMGEDLNCSHSDCPVVDNCMIVAIHCTIYKAYYKAHASMECPDDPPPFQPEKDDKLQKKMSYIILPNSISTKF